MNAPDAVRNVVKMVELFIFRRTSTHWEAERKASNDRKPLANYSEASVEGFLAASCSAFRFWK